MAVKDANRARLGVTFDGGRTSIATVQADTPAQRAGLAPGDEILAVNGLRVTNDTWADVFDAVAAIGKPLEVLFARRGVIERHQAVPDAGPGTIALELDAEADARAVALREAWLPRRDAAGAASSS